MSRASCKRKWQGSDLSVAGYIHWSELRRPGGNIGTSIDLPDTDEIAQQLQVGVTIFAKAPFLSFFKQCLKTIIYSPPPRDHLSIA